ncbi:callose synthase 3-like isoform X2 [Spinacia oleracea]|uniref:Callose synthase 3-like isoform X2 n=1 Tax=Spinacia oleracea TaxID=3562 RepID=A0A9R0HZH7_SPIOL|nr:callose synthase 3-like isoform X2 [Spinacia oleracea]
MCDAKCFILEHVNGFPMIQWPPFHLRISIALDMAKDNNGKHRELIKRIEVDPYMSCGFREFMIEIKQDLAELHPILFVQGR